MTNNLKRKKDKRQILWCGRLIDLKKPYHALEMAKKLKDNGYDFRLKIIGNGQLYEEMQRQIFKLSLQNQNGFGVNSYEEIMASRFELLNLNDLTIFPAEQK